MSEDNEPDWSTQLAKAAEQFIRDARRAKTSGGSALSFAQRVALAVDAGLRELLPSPESLVINCVVYAQVATATATVPSPTVNATATAAGQGMVTASGSVVLPPMSFSGQGTVEDRRGWFAGMSAGQIVAVVLVWLVAYALPVYLYSQSPTPSTLIEGDLATVALAYQITCRILDKRK